MRATMPDTAKVIEVLGDQACELSRQTFLRAVELYFELHGVWPTKLYITVDYMRVAQDVIKGSPWENMVYIVDDPPHFNGWFVGIAYDHGVGSEDRE